MAVMIRVPVSEQGAPLRFKADCVVVLSLNVLACRTLVMD
jgi:hypothetical protein